MHVHMITLLLLQDEVNLTDCSVCVKSRRNVLFVPCGHVTCCEACAPTVERCSICQQEIDSKVVVREGGRELLIGRFFSLPLLNWIYACTHHQLPLPFKLGLLPFKHELIECSPHQSRTHWLQQDTAVPIGCNRTEMVIMPLSYLDQYCMYMYLQGTPDRIAISQKSNKCH